MSDKELSELREAVSSVYEHGGVALFRIVGREEERHDVAELLTEFNRMEAELLRFREREPLVQELVEAVMNDPSETPFDEYACLIVRFGSCITPASTDTASEANAAGSSGSEPAE